MVGDTRHGRRSFDFESQINLASLQQRQPGYSYTCIFQYMSDAQAMVKRGIDRLTKHGWI